MSKSSYRDDEVQRAVLRRSAAPGRSQKSAAEVDAARAEAVSRPEAMAIAAEAGVALRIHPVRGFDTASALGVDDESFGNRVDAFKGGAATVHLGIWASGCALSVPASRRVFHLRRAPTGLQIPL